MLTSLATSGAAPKLDLVHTALAPNGLWQAARHISGTEGLARFWRGVTSVFLGAGPAHALYFATYEQCKLAWIEKVDVGHAPVATGKETDPSSRLTSHSSLPLPPFRSGWCMCDDRE
jgi:hypothetical protein